MGCPPPLPRIGLAGLGPWGRNHARSLHRMGVLHAVCDPDPEALDWSIRHHPTTRPYPSLEAMLANPELDAVVLATPAALHAEHVRLAVESGRHVLVEKPLALSCQEGEELVRLASRRGRVLAVGHLMLHHPATRMIEHILREGKLGRLPLVEARRTNFGRLRDTEDVLWSLAVHDVALMLELLGEEPNEVRCEGRYALGTPRADEALLLLRFPSGTFATIHVSWLYPLRERRLALIGESAQLVFDDTAPWNAKLALHRNHVQRRAGHPPRAVNGEVLALPLQEREPLEAELDDFVRAVQTGRPPRSDGAHALRVLRVLEAAERSMTLGGTPQPLQAPSSSPSVEPAQRPTSRFVHPSAHVDSSASLGPRTRVWHGAHICQGARIGSDCTLGQNVYVGPGVEVGDGCKLQNDVSLFEGVVLERNVFCGPAATFTNVRRPRAAFPRREQFERTLVREGATLGANCTILCGVTIGRHAMVGAAALVLHDVPDHALVVGNPARRIGWVCACGQRLSEAPDGTWSCACGRRYRPEGEGLADHRG